MRKALLIAAGCLIGLAQAGLAATIGDHIYYIKLSKPNTSYSTFMFDRQACLASTMHKVRENYIEAAGHRYNGVNVQYDPRAFIICMKARGYVLDPNGYRAIGYQVDTDGVMWGVPMDQWR